MYKLYLRFMYKGKMIQEILYLQSIEQDKIFFRVSHLIQHLRKCGLKAAGRHSWKSYTLYIDVEDEAKLGLFRICNWDILSFSKYIKTPKVNIVKNFNSSL